MTALSQGNKKITARKIPATNNKVLVRTGSFALFQEIPATNYKILIGTSTGMRDCSTYDISWLGSSLAMLKAWL